MEMLPSSRVLPSGPSRQHPAIYRDLPGQENYCRRYIQACCLMRPRFLAPYPCLSPTAWPHEACVALGRCSPRARRGPSPVLQQRLEGHNSCFQSCIGPVGRVRRGILAADCAAGPLGRRGTCAQRCPGAQKERARGQMASHPTEHSKSVCILFSPGLNLRGATHLVCRGRCSTLCQQEARALLICCRAEVRRKKLVSEAVRPKSTLKLAQQFSKGQTLHLRRRAASEQWR